ncbi:MAG TPA: helix-turn-helix domain-containing protein [Mycobacterium sp.]|nr:helix-turn-helix domain-containing protein [Mycobacterium sp.]
MSGTLGPTPTNVCNYERSVTLAKHLAGSKRALTAYAMMWCAFVTPAWCLLMSRRTPAVDRTVALMSFLAGHPDEAFTLTELARELNINKATTHSIVSTLVDVGWILRDTRKQYRLGPGLIAIADVSANRHQLALNAAHDHMRALATEFGLRCIASGLVGNELVVLAAEGSATPAGITIEVGLRAPLELPEGALFLAWSDEATIDKWLLAEGFANEELVARYRDALAQVRRHGFAVIPPLSGRQRMSELLMELSRGMPSPRARLALRDLLADLEREEADLIITEIRSTGHYEGGFIGAPVFDEAGQVLIVLGLIDFGGSVSGTVMLDRVTRVFEAARDVTQAINGKPPADYPQTAPSRRCRR